MKPSTLILGDESVGVPLSDQPHNSAEEVRRMTVRVGKAVPRVGLGAVIKGEYTRMDPAGITDRWVALCFLSVLQGADVGCLNRQATNFALEGAVLLTVLPEEVLLDPVQHRELQKMTVPVVTDPLNRLHRAYGIPRHPLSLKAQTFLIDPERILRHHVVHDLNMWSMDSVCRLMNLKQDANLNNTRHITEGARNVVRAS